MSAPNMDRMAVNVIKGLVMDGTRKANSGHPGGPMSSADFAYILYKEFLNHSPDDAQWFNRDRFVLSAGHESMLLYALLAFQGRITVDDLKAFRQWKSRTPGHPEVHVTPGVEATTGPLGQGFSMSVGMAVAECMLRARLGDDVCSHFTYALSSDGDLQEPVCLGSAALAGHWGLGRLIVFYDSNHIQLSGPTKRSDTTNYKTVFEGFGWHVLEIDGHDHDAIRQAIRQAQAETSRPSLIIGHTTIAKGTATREGDFETHGSPLPADEIAASKKKMGLPEDQFFYMPQDVLEHFRVRHAELRAAAARWTRAFEEKLEKDAAFQELWRVTKRAPGNRSFAWPRFEPGSKIATRSAWGKCLESLVDSLPILVGGSADLDPSNMTVKFREAVGNFSAHEPLGRNLAFGVREFPMGAICNGIALHGGLVPFGATFLTFADYERNALRMSALQHLPVLHVFTHDSFHLGEDGPTHQPVEHICSLRLIPNMLVMRPADGNETALCLETALKQTSRPTCLMFSRQNLPVMDPAAYPAVLDGAAKGGYVLRDAPGGKPDLIILASGSEVPLALAAADLLPERKVRVVNMVCMELFDEQPQLYRDEVLPPSCCCRAAVEAGRTELWYKYVGLGNPVLGLNHFGDSAPPDLLAEKYGFTAENLARMIRERLALA
ncbi:Transketolase [Fundidesulfovibrio magnetotacticus]|uniref:Transketolase n=1 Tax=Fundidesulfovibrio magnetotacticus TaxID=2730080 RepID=A0A6V8LZ36_9BACT|nr:transketolase [Fundidesulfovibrio magnetotacticus]GFK95498.1 Transketolase [Fundidesulfovibrio magnetotacticus]